MNLGQFGAKKGVPSLLFPLEEHHHGNFALDGSQLGGRHLGLVIDLDSGNAAAQAGTRRAVDDGISVGFGGIES